MKLSQLRDDVVIENRTPNVVADLTTTLKDKVKGKTAEQAKKLVRIAVEDYFKKEIFSVDKEEWEKKMTPEQKSAFVDTLFKKVFKG